MKRLPRRQSRTFDAITKDYILKSVEDDEIIEKDVSVAAFNANSGYGRIYDADLGHTVALYIPEGLQSEYRSIIGWGLSEYSKGTGRKVSLKSTRVLALDGRPKKYIVLEAAIPSD